MGAAAALIRSSFLVAGIASVACGPVAPDSALRSSETIVGRTTRDGQIVLLTDAPALLTIDPAAARLSRQPVVAADAAALKPWGLVEQDGSLFTVSGFVDLTRIDAEGVATRIARLGRPVSNLLDLDNRMAAQYASGETLSALVVSVAVDGRFSALQSPARDSYGLSAVEEDVLHLLTCSARAPVVCWLPHRAATFEMVGAALVAGPSLEGLPQVDVSQVIAGQGRRLFDDILVDEDGNYLVLHRSQHADREQGLTLFDRVGRPARTIRLHEPLRLLLAADSRSVLALTRGGALTKVTLAW